MNAAAGNAALTRMQIAHDMSLPADGPRADEDAVGEALIDALELHTADAAAMLEMLAEAVNDYIPASAYEALGRQLAQMVEGRL